MHYIFLLLTLTTASLAEKRCQGVKFDNAYYQLETVREGINNVHQLAYNRKDNTVYFIYELLYENPTNAVGYLNLDTKESGSIAGVRNPTSVAVDQNYSEVYVGGSDGIYKLNNLKVPEKLPIEDEKDSIVSLFFKDGLYYTNKRDEAYIYFNGHSELLPELRGTIVESLGVDNKNIFFLQGKMLNRLTKGTRAVNTHERYKVNLITSDDHRVYFGAVDGVYVYDEYKYVLKKVSDLRDLKALTFNKFSEPIYAVADKIVTMIRPCFERI